MTLRSRVLHPAFGAAAYLAIVACAAAQIIDLHGRVRLILNDAPGIIQANVGDPVTVSFTLNRPHTTEGTTLALFSHVPLTVKLGQNNVISIAHANARMEVNYMPPGGSEFVWGISAFAEWLPNPVTGGEVGIYTALHSLADIGNTLSTFPNNVPLESFDLYNGGSASFRSSGAQIIWNYESYTVRPNSISAAPEPATYGWVAMGLLIVAGTARKVRGRRSGAKPVNAQLAE
jgi:hypothetical protein